MASRFLALVLGVGLVAAALATENTPIARSTPTRLPEALLAAVEKSHPSMRVIERKDLSVEDCEGLGGDHPGWVSADFNGDGFLDYGVLLISAVPNKRVTFQGKEYAIRSALVAVYLGKADDRFKEIALYEFDEALPTIRGIKLQQPEKIHDISGNRYVTLLHPAFTFFSCGQFSVVYFWDGRHFDTVKTSK